MNRSYVFPAMKELRDQQVRFVPREKKIEQSSRAELLYRVVEPESQYSFRFVCQQITDFRSDLYPEIRFPGNHLQHDLLFFIEDLHDAANVSVDEHGEKVWMIEELTERFQVSSKTISRWRKTGLVARRFLFDGKKRVGFLQGSVDFFIENHAPKIQRGMSFSQLSSEEKEEIIRTARRFSGTDASPTEVAKRIAKHTGRSVETIRYTLKSFDDQNSDIPLFPNRNSPLDEETKQRIFQEHRQSVSIEQLARNYHRTRGSIYRLLGQLRAKRIAEFVLDFVDNPDFPSFIGGAKEKEILANLPTPETATKARKSKPRRFSMPIDDQPDFTEVDSEDASPAPTESGESGLPPYLLGLYRIPLLTAEQEVHLFRKLNFLKYRATKLREQLDPFHPKAYLMQQIENLYEQAVATKNDIVSANLRLVVSIAKRHIGPYSNFFDLISDGNMSLIRAVEKFDYGRGNRFSTYATWAISRNFARTIPMEKKYRDRFLLGDEELFESAVDNRTDSHMEERFQSEREVQVGRLLHELDEREQRIIVSRFGIGPSNEPLTLNEVGVEIGVTKERIRQIEARALAKLRKIAEEEHLEIPGLQDT